MNRRSFLATIATAAMAQNKTSNPRQFNVMGGVYELSATQAGVVSRVKGSPLMAQFEQNIAGYDFVKKTALYASYIGMREPKDTPFSRFLHPVQQEHLKETALAADICLRSIDASAFVNPSVFKGHQKAIGDFLMSLPKQKATASLKVEERTP